jgi:hypothetical protein
MMNNYHKNVYKLRKRAFELAQEHKILIKKYLEKTKNE